MSGLPMMYQRTGKDTGLQRRTKIWNSYPSINDIPEHKQDTGALKGQRSIRMKF